LISMPPCPAAARTTTMRRMMNAPPMQGLYPSGPVPEVRDLLALDPRLLDASPEAIAERLDLDPRLVEAALEALTQDGEVVG
jgi:hypothetical protein